MLLLTLKKKKPLYLLLTLKKTFFLYLPSCTPKVTSKAVCVLTIYMYMTFRTFGKVMVLCVYHKIKFCISHYLYDVQR